MLISNTPIIPYEIEPHYHVYVKREDLCCVDGPNFSKIRGVYEHLKTVREDTIGVLDTYHSKAGWAVAMVPLDIGITTDPSNISLSIPKTSNCVSSILSCSFKALGIMYES